MYFLIAGFFISNFKWLKLSFKNFIVMRISKSIRFYLSEMLCLREERKGRRVLSFWFTISLYLPIFLIWKRYVLIVNWREFVIIIMRRLCFDCAISCSLPQRCSDRFLCFLSNLWIFESNNWRPERSWYDLTCMSFFAHQLFLFFTDFIIIPSHF